MRQEHRRPVIETLINSAALALFTFGIQQIITIGDYKGFLCIAFGTGLEFVKYSGRKIELW